VAVVFMDGFDYYYGKSSVGTFTGDLSRRWTGATGNLQWEIQRTYSRTGRGQGIQGWGDPGYLYKTLGSSYTQGIIGGAFRPSSWTSLNSLLVAYDNTTEQLSVRTNGLNQLIVSRSGTTLATGTTVLTNLSWHYIELGFTIHPSAGSIELKLDGASEIALTTSLNTRSTSTTQWTGFALGNGASSMYVDDVYAIDSSTGPNTTFLGPIQVVALPPSAIGNSSSWSPNGGSNLGTLVEEFQDVDLTFNQSSTTDQIDTFSMRDLPIATGTVYAIQHVITARQDVGAARSIAPVTRVASTDYAGSAQTLTTSQSFVTEILDQNPATSSGWSVSDVNDMEAGYKLVS
jgi:hypothetical protein